MAESDRVVVFMLVMIAFLLIATALYRTALVTAIDVNLTGISPDWYTQWENFVAVQVNSSISEITVNLTFGSYKPVNCSDGILLVQNSEPVPYQITDEYHSNGACTGAVVVWNNTIYSEIVTEPVEVTTYYLYFGSLNNSLPITPTPNETNVTAAPTNETPIGVVKVPHYVLNSTPVTEETINVSGVVKTKITYTNGTPDSLDDTVYLFLWPENSSEIAVMAFPGQNYTFGNQTLSQTDVFNDVDVWSTNYIFAEVQQIQPQLVPFYDFGFYQSTEGFAVTPDSYTPDNGTYVLVSLYNVSSS